MHPPKKNLAALPMEQLLQLEGRWRVAPACFVDAPCSREFQALQACVERHGEGAACASAYWRLVLCLVRHY